MLIACDTFLWLQTPLHASMTPLHASMTPLHASMTPSHPSMTPRHTSTEPDWGRGPSAATPGGYGGSGGAAAATPGGLGGYGPAPTPGTAETPGTAGYAGEHWGTAPSAGLILAATQLVVGHLLFVPVSMRLLWGMLLVV